MGLKGTQMTDCFSNCASIIHPVLLAFHPSILVSFPTLLSWTVLHFLWSSAVNILNLCTSFGLSQGKGQMNWSWKQGLFQDTQWTINGRQLGFRVIETKKLVESRLPSRKDFIYLFSHGIVFVFGYLIHLLLKVVVSVSYCTWFLNGCLILEYVWLFS